MASCGTVKSFNSLKGFGFIEVEGVDIFVHARDCKEKLLNVGDVVNFDAENSPSKPGTYKAANVTGGTGALVDGSGGCGATKGAGKGAGVVGTGSCQATVKSFNPMKGFGFILYEGTDVFVNIKDCVDGGLPLVGDVLTFDVAENPQKPGTYKASNVTGGTGVLDNGKGKGKGKDTWGGGKGASFGKCEGPVKSFSPQKGFGFILYEGTDVFVNIKDCADGAMPQAGDVLWFDVQENPQKPGTYKAFNVSGGSMFWDGSQYSKGYGKGKGGDDWGYGGKGGDGYGPAWDNGKGWGKGPYKGDAWGGGDSWGGKGKGGYGKGPAGAGFTIKLGGKAIGGW